ncbi:MAG: undecaprenyl-diphosphate phosphatase [Clostridia bacterium]|nr:undecaprenyl-diphosphate phosphatase [Clostridia bacterium]MCI8979738.1 undecaprenyl-diphosphate phosphatase [Clostridia bacterium]MCI9085884.1 undecaprenyl-diphosphate phosphatase [Clostridia bacterium]NDO19104.1 undecaprenyl-diphosphate phosphatase [Lachnospiraceae bacterium MD329]
MFLNILNAIVFGVVQGITEWLPISSTGHMILLDQFIRLGHDKAFKDLFFVVIQFGSILAVVTLYFRKLNPFSPSKSAIEKRDTWTMWGKVLVGCIPAAVIGLLFDKLIMEKTYNWYVVAAALIIYGILFIVIESRNKTPKINAISEMSYRMAAAIGIFQVLAMIPGTSRSGSTILGAVILGAGRNVAAEFSFFLAVPVMLGASALEILKYFMEFGLFSGEQWITLLVGMIVAYVVSIFAIRFLMDYIRRHDFKAFGYYRIILGIIVILYFTISHAAVVG